MILSHLSSKESSTPILLLTFDPPTIAANGRFGESIAPCKYFNSFSKRNPATEDLNNL